MKMSDFCNRCIHHNPAETIAAPLIKAKTNKTPKLDEILPPEMDEMDELDEILHRFFVEIDSADTAFLSSSPNLTNNILVDIFKTEVKVEDPKRVFPEDVKFSYLYKDSKPVVTIASRRIQRSGNTASLYEFAVAYCSGKDIPSKYTGRSIAYDRLESLNDHKYYGNIVVNPTIETHHNINLMICSSIIITGAYPSYMKDVILENMVSIGHKISK